MLSRLIAQTHPLLDKGIEQQYQVIREHQCLDSMWKFQEHLSCFRDALELLMSLLYIRLKLILLQYLGHRQVLPRDARCQRKHPVGRSIVVYPPGVRHRLEAPRVLAHVSSQKTMGK